MNATEDCLGAPGSWLAWKEGGTLFIRGVVRYPNNFSTARLSPDPKWTSDTGTPHFVLGFGRDKQPFCGPDLVGQVHYQGPWPGDGPHSIVVIDAEARISLPVKAG